METSTIEAENSKLKAEVNGLKIGLLIRTQVLIAR
jgi:hypothetical protein